MTYRFSKIHHDGKMVSVVIWHGFYLAYLGFTDPTRSWPDHVKMLGETPIQMRSSEVFPTLGMDIILYGFDTAHIWDTNIGPDGKVGLSPVIPSSATAWTKELIFETLDKIADEVLHVS